MNINNPQQHSVQQQQCTSPLALPILLAGGAMLMFTMLQSNELWTMESRWATVCWLMLRHHDYFHPHLFNAPYFDKPLLSYWYIIAIAKICGNLNEWALRLPSALAGMCALYCTYRLGKILFNATTALIAGGLLVTNYFFIFWSRTASADMLNVAGVLLAMVWYFEHREEGDGSKRPRFSIYLVFFLVTAFASQCKGLIGFIIPTLGVLVDLVLTKKWRQHVSWQSIAALAIAVLVYLFPFIIAALTHNWQQATLDANVIVSSSNSNGLYAVFHENVLRYFVPFDHNDPVYTYFTALLLYLLPWAALLLFAGKTCIAKWRQQKHASRWLALFILVLFIFFTASGSRRGYYILPLVPFVTLFIADWLYNIRNKLSYCWIAKLKTAALCFYFLIFTWFIIAQPLLNLHSNVQRQFAAQIKVKLEQLEQKENVSKNVAIKKSKIFVLNSNDSGFIFYLNPAQGVVTIDNAELSNLLQQEKTKRGTVAAIVVVAMNKELSQLQKLINENNLNKQYKILITTSNADKDPIVMMPANI